MEIKNHEGKVAQKNGIPIPQHDDKVKQFKTRWISLPPKKPPGRKTKIKIVMQASNSTQCFHHIRKNWDRLRRKGHLVMFTKDERGELDQEEDHSFKMVSVIGSLC